MKKIVIAIFLIITSNLFSDYTDMKIQDFINIVAVQNNINIVTDKSIEKKFDFYINRSIKGGTNINVLKELLDTNGFILQKKNENYYLVKSKEDLLINKIEIYKLNYVDTKKVKAQAEQILKGYFKNIKRVKTYYDNKKFTPMEERKNGSGNSNMQTKETEEKIEYSINILDNKSIAVTYKDDFVPSVVEKIINAMDIAPVRIKVKVKIYEVSTNALKQYATDLGLAAEIGGVSLGFNSSPTDGVVDVGLGYDSASSVNKINVGAVINALEKNGDARVTAEPSVFIYEGHSATLTEGKSYPVRYGDSVVNNSSTSTTSKNYKNEDTGLTLDLKFEQFRRNMIYLKMSLNINIVDDYDADEKQLITIKRALDTQMIIEPNTEIDMAGLTRSVDSMTQGGIPVLKEIPWLGKLFEFEKEIHDENILVIRLIATIIENPENKYADTWTK